MITTFLENGSCKKTILTVRDLANKYPTIYDYYYNFRNFKDPKNIEDFIANYGYKLVYSNAIFDNKDLISNLDCKIIKRTTFKR
jgi:hypothetical protein